MPNPPDRNDVEKTAGRASAATKRVSINSRLPEGNDTGAARVHFVSTIRSNLLDLRDTAFRMAPD
jgi:hypothetical protein